MKPAPAALVYDDSAYLETVQRPSDAGVRGPHGLMGRQVAGREFLDAYLTRGDWSELTAVVYNAASATSLLRTCADHPSSRVRQRGLRVVTMDRFREGFFPAPAPVLYTPCPPDPSFAWARLQWGPGSFALCGVTHTLCSAGAVRTLCELLTAPYEPYDALICTSTAVVRMVRAVTDAYAAYLRDRCGGDPRLRVRLEAIPIGVNPERFRPPTPEERAERRAALHIADDEVAVLCVGRFTPHAKAHPFPMFQGLSRAARATGRRVHLILSGWAPHESLLQAYLDGLRTFAPGMPVSVVDGMNPDLRFGVWHAADLVTSLADNLQETFGLVVVEAMASGLPVVASDWDGYRDLVAHGETGLLVPTAMVRDATVDSTMRLMLGATDYDAFLAECSQAISVDPAAAATAYAQLLGDADLRQRMGRAARQRVVENFSWAGVVRRYESLWRDQEAVRQEVLRTQAADPGARAPAMPLPGPACYPAPEWSFAGYPTDWLDENSIVQATAHAAAELAPLLRSPLCNYAGERRVQDETLLRRVLDATASPRSITAIEQLLGEHGVGHRSARATIAWLLKYGVLRR